MSSCPSLGPNVADLLRLVFAARAYRSEMQSTRISFDSAGFDVHHQLDGTSAARTRQNCLPGGMSLVWADYAISTQKRRSESSVRLRVEINHQGWNLSQMSAASSTKTTYSIVPPILEPFKSRHSIPNA